jgi:hypothetical protein
LGTTGALEADSTLSLFSERTYNRIMRAWIEVPDESSGWGSVRVLRGRLEDDGYHTEEYRVISHIMIYVTASRPSEIASPPAWRGAQALH